MDSISLTSSMRANLLALKNASSLTGTVQNRLATGLKVNSALDNPVSYYTARSLHNRAGDLSVLLDSMSMGIQTIKAATEGVKTGIKILEQMRSVTEQALLQLSEPASVELAPVEEWQPVELTTRDLSEFEAEGYKVITADMSTYAIGKLMTDGAKLVLAEDVTLDKHLSISCNVTIDGNGHTLSYATDLGFSALEFSSSTSVLRNINIDYTNERETSYAAVSVSGGSVEISSVNINCKGDYVHGVIARNNANVIIDTTAGIHVDGEGAQKVYNPDAPNAILFNDPNSSVYNGRANTEAMLKEIGAKALTATAANQFYVGDKNDAYFGQGKWYLPAIGEWAEAYGTDIAQIDGDYYGNDGATGDNLKVIQETLATLKAEGVEAEELGKNDKRYWSSSKYSASDSWRFNVSDGNRRNASKTSNFFVRCFQLLENCFSSTNGPKIGDVMYTDLSYGSADNYDDNKTAAGVVTWVSEDGKSAKIMNLKDLSFSSYNQVGNFDPDNPYNNIVKNSYHSINVQKEECVKGIDDFTRYFKTSITFTNDEEEAIYLQNAEHAVKQFNELLEQYNKLINDSSYKGINLINGDLFSVVFNEDMSSRIEMSGHDITSEHLGLNAVAWETAYDVAATIESVAQAVSTLRDVSVALGNSYSIIQTRHNFTQNLINVLTEGADDLTLADMNEEAANMLALQTRQQLGVTALSLSAQSARSVLTLFQS